MTGVGDELSALDADRWGLPAAAVDDLGSRLQRFWLRFRHRFRSKTRDTSEHGCAYLRGLLTMAKRRNYANIARRVLHPEVDGQSLQQFVSDSPWSARAVFDQIQAEIRQRSELQGGVLILDESGDKRSGAASAGAARQYVGRLGNVEMGQVGVTLGYYQADVWAMVDAELYLPEHWFDDDHAKLRQRSHVPPEREFATKPELGMRMVKRARANGLPFAMVACDSFYGQDFDLRAELDGQGLFYMADILSNMYVWLKPPQFGEPKPPTGKRGRPCSRREPLNSDDLIQVRHLPKHPEFRLQWVDVRHAERGMLRYECWARRVWMVRGDRQRAEWLFVQRDSDGKLHFSLSNAPADASLHDLALSRSRRYFGERTFQDAKSEAGWDELVARKYRAWEHHTALTAMALWFVAETKLDWARDYPRDPSLARQLQVEVLPLLSMANVRELLGAVMPLRQLSKAEATRLVTKHLVDRSRSTASRLKTQQRSGSSP